MQNTYPVYTSEEYQAQADLTLFGSTAKPEEQADQPALQRVAHTVREQGMFRRMFSKLPDLVKGNPTVQDVDVESDGVAKRHARGSAELNADDGDDDDDNHGGSRSARSGGASNEQADRQRRQKFFEDALDQDLEAQMEDLEVAGNGGGNGSGFETGRRAEIRRKFKVSGLSVLFSKFSFLNNVLTKRGAVGPLTQVHTIRLDQQRRCFHPITCRVLHIFPRPFFFELLCLPYLVAARDFFRRFILFFASP